VDGCSETWWTHFSSRQGGLLVLLFLWTLWAMGRLVHKSAGLVDGLSQVDRAQAMGAEVDGEDPIFPGRAQGDQLAAQALADAPVAVPETDEAVAADFADLIIEAVFDRRQNLGERPRARPVALRRRRHAERFMRPLMVVEGAPVVEGALALGEIAETATADHLRLEGPMEALFLALGLGMTRPAVRHANAKPREPDAEPGRGSPPGSLHGEPPSISMASGRP
jgi:hypothetical protein